MAEPETLQSKYRHHSTNVYRVLYCCLISVVFWQRDALQTLIDKTWTILLTNWFFRCVYFETWWVVLVYAVLIVWTFVFHHITYFDQYKINPSMTWQRAGLRVVIMEAIEYCTPLMLLDTFMVKKYHGVDPVQIEEHRKNWIQYTRALPEAPPTVGQLVLQLACSLVIYDFLFCFVHFILHKNLWLYKNIHAHHHDHEFVHGRVTNQLAIPERIILVLAANQSLKIMHAHPLTRAVFVVFFVAWLLENHCGYELPWSLSKVVPCGIIAGAKQHLEHHTKGSRNYQPFFTYIDNYIINNKKLKIN